MYDWVFAPDRTLKRHRPTTSIPLLAMDQMAGVQRVIARTKQAIQEDAMVSTDNDVPPVAEPPLDTTVHLVPESVPDANDVTTLEPLSQSPLSMTPDNRTPPSLLPVSEPPPHDTIDVPTLVSPPATPHANDTSSFLKPSISLSLA